MASIQCKICKKGIHYHGEPTGVEYIIIERANWDRIMHSSFDPSQRTYNVIDEYPKLFRSDTIPEDFPDVIEKFWKCPDCGTLLFFDHEGRVTNTYVPDEQLIYSLSEMKAYGVFFDDYAWDELTERAISNKKIPEIIPATNSIYISENGLVMQEDSGNVIYYKKQ